MPQVEVHPVANKRELAAFIKLPWKIYRQDPNWVPPLIVDQKDLLNTRKNPFYQHSEIRLFLAYQGREAVGRLAAVIDHNYNEFHNEKTGLFGFFEAVDDVEVSRALFEAAAAWHAEKGMDRQLGPANPSTNHILGLLIDPFDRPPMVMMPYNPPYYPRLLERCGFRKAKDLYAYHMDDTIPISEKIRRITGIIKKRHNITIRSAQKKYFRREVELIKTVYNDAWTRNWGFVPWTDEEIDHLGKDIKMIADPDLILLAFVDGEIAGLCLSLPNINLALKKVKNGRLFPFGLFKLLMNLHKVNEVRCAVMGIRHRYRMMGIDAVFYHDTYKLCVKKNSSKNVEISWVLEDNLSMCNTLERWGSIRYKTYRLFQKELSPSG